MFSITANASTLTPVEIAKILRRANAEVVQSTHSTVGESDFILSGDSILINPVGTHYLYSFLPSRNTFIRLDHSHFHGHNFVRELFMYKGEIFAFGGYGFWEAHSRLIRFDRKSCEWELVMVKNTAQMKGKPLITVLQGDSIYVYGTIENHIEGVGTRVNLQCYILNLKTLEILEYTDPQIPNEILQCSAGFNSQNSNYVVFGSPNSILYIFDKQKQILYKNASGPGLFHELNTTHQDYLDSVFRFIMGKEIISVLPDLSLGKMDIENYIQLYCFPEGDFHRWKLKSSTIIWTDFFYPYILIILIVAVIFLGYHFISKGGINSGKILKQYADLDSSLVNIDKIKPLAGNVYTEKEIDLIFRISHLNNQMRKIKRSKMIYQFNQELPGIIQKLPNQENSSEFLYKINDN